MPYILFHTYEVSSLEANMPQPSDIEAAFLAYTNYAAEPNKGRFIGPSPRIVRKANTGGLTGYVTYAAWLYSWPDNDYVRTNWQDSVNHVLRDIQHGFAEVMPTKNWDPVLATPWNEAVNGPVSFWRCDSAASCAVNTRTRVETPGMFSSEYVENPFGPDTAATHPTGSPDPFAGLGSAVDKLKALGIVAAVLLGLVYVGPIVAGMFRRRPAPPQLARRNPRSRARGRRRARARRQLAA